MIVRIMGEGQFKLSDEVRERVNELDNECVAAVERGDEDAFHACFEDLLALVRSDGEHLPDEDLHPSDVIIPPADTSFAEAAGDFSGDGLIPD